MNQERWKRAVSLHAEAAADFAKRASAVPAERWSVPRAEGKWTPAQVVEHLTLAYDVLLREMDGGPGMRFRPNLPMRMFLRWTVLPRLLRGRPFPRAAAPRETRPAVASANQSEAIAKFQVRAAEFERAAQEVQRAGRKIRLTHAYFGRVTLMDSVTLCARHIAHHRLQLSES